MKRHWILTINPGSTSTKVAVFEESVKRATQTIEHPVQDLNNFNTLWTQRAYRRKRISEFLSQSFPETTFAIVAARGGLLRPVTGGIYKVNDGMLTDAEQGRQGHHASNLGCALAKDFSKEFHCPAVIVDPVSTNELERIARISGHPAIERRSLSHALNLHYVARKGAEDLGIALEHARFVVAHLGGGISIAPIEGGKIVDVNDANNEGPFSATRSGSLPPLTLSKWILEQGFTFEEVQTELQKKSGLMGYLGTTDGRDIEQRIEAGDDQATFIIDAMAYQISKEIAAMCTVLFGDVHRIFLTGGLAKLHRLVELILPRIHWIAPVTLYPGEYEMEALAEGGLRALMHPEEVKEY